MPQSRANSTLPNTGNNPSLNSGEVEEITAALPPNHPLNSGPVEEITATLPANIAHPTQEQIYAAASTAIDAQDAPDNARRDY